MRVHTLISTCKHTTKQTTLTTRRYRRLNKNTRIQSVDNTCMYSITSPILHYNRMEKKYSYLCFVIINLCGLQIKHSQYKMLLASLQLHVSIK